MRLVSDTRENADSVVLAPPALAADNLPVTAIEMV